MKKVVFIIMFCLIISSYGFTQDNNALAIEMFNRIHDRTQIWWRNNYSIIDEFDFSPRTNSNIQIISLSLTQQIKINTIMFQNVINRKELTEEEIYFYYLEQYKLCNYMETTIGGMSGANEILRGLAEELRTMVIRSCLLLLEQ